MRSHCDHGLLQCSIPVLNVAQYWHRHFESLPGQGFSLPFHDGDLLLHDGDVLLLHDGVLFLPQSL